MKTTTAPFYRKLADGTSLGFLPLDGAGWYIGRPSQHAFSQDDCQYLHTDGTWKPYAGNGGFFPTQE